MHASIGTPALWVGFLVFLFAMLAIDLLVFQKKAHSATFREAVGWTIVWVALAMGFDLGIFLLHGSRPALEFLTGYVIEYSLSVDNLFVFMVLFGYFAVPKEYQHRVLFWGILGALIMRAAFILVGAALIEKFHWLMYVFGAFLVFTAIRLLMKKEEDVEPETNPILRLCRRFLPVVSGFRGEKFIVVEDGRRYATPLLLVLAVVEGTDVMFALDSVPAIFAVTTDPYILFTSNMFAILGLRALYFVVSGLLGKFHYLNFGLGLVLLFVGIKMLIMEWVKIPIGISLGVVAALLAGAVVASIVWPGKTNEQPTSEHTGTPQS